MTATQTHDSTSEVKRAQTARAERVCSAEWLERHVRPHLGADAREVGDSWTTHVIQLDGTGAATVRMEVGGSPPVFAKLFPFGDGPTVYTKLQALRDGGLGAGNRYQVVEPLAWIEADQVLICRGAPGRPISELLGGDGDLLAAATAEAGRWLGRLHGSNLRIGRPHSLLVSGELISMASRLVKVGAEHPGYARLARSLLKQLDALTYDTVDGLQAQSHGQYRPIHVFLTDDVVTVIDLDRSGPADPARDVAEFLHRLRLGVHTATGDMSRADPACASFLAGYRESAGGDEYLTNLRFHWARYVLHSLNGRIKTNESDYAEGGNAEFRLFRSEFERIVEGRAGA